MLKAESLDSDKKTTALKAQIDEQTRSATHHMEERDAAKRLAEKAEQELQKAFHESAEFEVEGQRSRREGKQDIVFDVLRGRD